MESTVSAKLHLILSNIDPVKKQIIEKLYLIPPSMLLYNRRKGMPLLLVLTFLIQIGSTHVFALTSSTSEFVFNSFPSDVNNARVDFLSVDLTISIQPISIVESYAIFEEVPMGVDDSYQQNNPLSAASDDLKKIRGDEDRKESGKLIARLIKELEEKLEVDVEISSLEYGKTESSLSLSATEKKTNLFLI